MSPKIDRLGVYWAGMSGTAATDDFRVVCLGGSAGGLKAYMGILGNLPPDTGMAFIVAPHRNFEQTHLLLEILARVTAMPVVEVIKGMLLQPNRVFVMPPGKDMTIERGVFDLTTTIAHGWPTTISIFMLSLAKVYGNRAVAVILSGMDRDGSMALESIKASGGVTFAQSDPTVNSMPRHAIETGHVDFILSPADIATALMDLSRWSYKQQ
jgi:two-component system CheB/CheR fusion protein